jgi:hypothetical protein
MGLVSWRGENSYSRKERKGKYGEERSIPALHTEP